MQFLPRPPAQPSDRNLQIMERHERGETLADIAKDVGLSPSRTWQIYRLTKRRLEEIAHENAKAPEWCRPFFNLLSTRAKNVIREQPDVVDMTVNDVLKIPNCGKLTVAELQHYLRLHGIKSRMLETAIGDPGITAFEAASFLRDWADRWEKTLPVQAKKLEATIRLIHRQERTIKKLRGRVFGDE